MLIGLAFFLCHRAKHVVSRHDFRDPKKAALCNFKAKEEIGHVRLTWCLLG